jgi:superfamily I DNA and/or RNA helicase
MSNTILESWKNKLIDFSRRNKLLHFKPGYGAVIEIEATAHEIIDKLVTQAASLNLRPSLKVESIDAFSASADEIADPEEEFFDFGDAVSELDDTSMLATASQDYDLSTSLQSNLVDSELDKILGRLRSRAKVSLNEQGVNTLYLATHFLRWQEKANSDEFYSPLILIPLSISQKGLSGSYEIQLMQDEFSFNPTLLYKFKQDFGLDLEPALDDLDDAIEENQLEKITSALTEAFKAHKKLTSKWEIEDKSFISLFSFAKLSMYQDLEQNSKEILAHPLIQQIQGQLETNSNTETEALEPSDVDKFTESMQVLDADSSQQAAIFNAKLGHSFVLQGPPGTGKSQTIANIIAEALADDKKVLFVSEKKAALDVVYERLKVANLEKFCLDLHSNKKSKAAIIQKLASSVEAAEQLALKDDPAFYVKPLPELKDKLNHNISVLHEIYQPINLSLYDLYTRQAELKFKLKDLPRFDFMIPNIENLSEENFFEYDFFFKELNSKNFIIANQHKFIWRNIKIQQLNYEIESEIKSRLITFQEHVSELLELANPIAAKYFNRNLSNLKELRWLAEAIKLTLESPFPEEEWLNSDNISEVENLTLNAKVKHDQLKLMETNILSKYSSDFLQLDHQEILLRFKSAYNNNSFRFFNLNYWKDLYKIKKMTLNKQVTGLSSLMHDLEKAAEYDQKQSELSEQQTKLEYNLGDFYKKFDTNWEETLTAVKWVKKVLSKLDIEKLPSSLEQVVADEKDHQEFAKLSAKFEQAFEVLSEDMAYYRSLFTVDDINIEHLSFAELRDHLQNLVGKLHEIEDWFEYKDLKAKARALGIGEFLEQIVEAQLQNQFSSEVLHELFMLRFYELWIDKIELENPQIRKFTGDAHNVLVEKFKELDAQLIENACRKLPEKLAAKWHSFSHNSANLGALNTLNVEINKKRKHKPIRLLVKEIPKLLKNLKPCWMMSPLAVSKIFDDNQSFKFDLVIFDEASQICTEDAVSAIYRGQQLILAGDSNQLPPTNFFNSNAASSDEDDENYEINDFESILDECSVFMPSKKLKWHYRSRHESLIQFSNQEIYDAQLITFPATIKESPDLGVHFRHVENGKFEKGLRINRKEAEAVASAVIEHYSSAKAAKTLGIIAFSEAQQGAIERELLKQIRKNKDFDESKIPDTFFIKNLESVQGDERDYIYFSIGYARDKKGNLSHNFGPLNREGGHRRLNVAVTRAKEKIMLFSSIVASDIELARTSARGAALLKAYLAYAKDQTAYFNKSKASLRLQSKQQLHNMIASFLDTEGYHSEIYYGSSEYKVDIAVSSKEDTSKFLLAIELDGEMYRSAASTRDRERLRHSVMQAGGWQIHRISSRSFARNPEAELKILLDKLSALKQQHSVLMTKAEPPASQDVIEAKAKTVAAKV